MSTATIYAGAGDGFIRRANSGAESWATLRNATSGSDVGPTTTADYGVAARKDSYLYRHFLPFDLSGVPAGATVTAVTVYVYVTATASGGGSSTANNSVTVVESSQASPTTLVANDYDNVGSTELVASRSSFAGLSTSAYNAFSLNAAGIALAQAAADADGYLKVALRSGYDLDNVAPSPDTAISDYETRYSEYASTTYDPYVVITYVMNRTTADTWGWASPADITGKSGGTIRTYSRTANATWAWSDTNAKPTTARTAGTQRTVWTQGSAGAFGAHYSFSVVVRTADNRLLAVCRKATTHGSYDGHLVGKYSTDDGNSWGSEFTIINGTTTGYDERDPYLLKLASGRLCLVNGRRKYNAAGDYSGQPQFYYSDDNGTTWSSGVSLVTGLFGGTAGTYFGEVYASDIIERHNGDLLVIGYGTHSNSVNHYDLFVSKSTDGGATWTELSHPATYSGDGYDTVEPQVEQFGNGKLLMVYHNGDGPPQTAYLRTSTDGGATWSARSSILSTGNRQGLQVMDDGQTVVLSYLYGYGDTKYDYIESRDYGVSWLTAVRIADVAASYPLWAMSVALAGVGNQQNVGFIYDAEVGGQAQSSVYYKQFSGMDGIFVYARSTADAWAWSDSNARTLTRTRTTGDSWAWSDTATRPVSPRTTSDTWGWASPGAAVRATAGGSGDSWAWSTPVVPATVTEGAGITIHPQGMVPGTAIAAYLRWEWRGPVAAKLNAGPGSAVQETTVGSDLTASFTLSPGEYVAYAPTYPTRRLFFMVTPD